MKFDLTSGASSHAQPRTRSGQTQRLLFFGFGGLWLLLAMTGLYALSVLGSIQTRNERIRQDYFNRDRILEQLRSDVYLSGTYVRDLLLEQDHSRAEMHRKELEDSRARIEANVASYEAILRPEERAPFQHFTSQVKKYFHSLSPALEWNAAQRQALGYAFTRDSLLPRRMMIVHLADQISEVNKRQMESGNQQIAVLFSDFRHSLIILLVLTMVCGTLLAAISIGRILRLERLSSQRFEAVEQARAALRDLSTRLIEVQESERRALSRELHDEVGQSLSALLLGIGNVAATISGEGSADTRNQLQALRKLVERTLAVVRDMSLLLRPSMLDDLGLIPALQWQAREASRTNNLVVRVQADEPSDDIPDEHKTCIYRLVQEALHNITRHANAKSIDVRLHQNERTLVLEICDDGQGFFPEREKGVGLLGMEERVNHLHGSFRVKSTPGEGTSIRVELPLSEKEAAALR
jgi:signal transduction histidine kinase